jgi:hypothetical protein
MKADHFLDIIWPDKKVSKYGFPRLRFASVGIVDRCQGCCWVSHFAITPAFCRLDWVQRNPTKPGVGETQPTKWKGVQHRTRSNFWNVVSYKREPLAKKTASLINKETSLEPKKFKFVNLSDVDRGSGFQPRLCKYGYSAAFFRGWKPLQREFDVM